MIFLNSRTFRNRNTSISVSCLFRFVSFLKIVPRFGYFHLRLLHCFQSLSPPHKTSFRVLSRFSASLTSPHSLAKWRHSRGERAQWDERRRETRRRRDVIRAGVEHFEGEGEHFPPFSFFFFFEWIVWGNGNKEEEEGGKGNILEAKETYSSVCFGCFRGKMEKLKCFFGLAKENE